MRSLRPYDLPLLPALLLPLFLSCAAGQSRAAVQEGEHAKDEAAQEEGADADEEEKEPFTVTTHTVRMGGEEVEYTAKAGTYLLTKEDGTERANVFYVEYTRTGVDDLSRRPITYCFNGGPGSSSVWLHLGVIGPRRVEMTDEGWAPAPPWKLVDNEHSPLRFTDLVFIDPVTTGYSRAAKDVDPGDFHGVDEDVESVAEFIRLHATRNLRWESPKFLAGESYGTTRAAGLAGHLLDRHGLFLNGIVLISSILEFQTARFDTGNDLPYVLFLPSFCATAYYHGRLDAELSRDLRKTLDEVEEFALGEYADALLLGDRLEPARRAEVAGRLARYLGLSVDYVERSNLRVRIGRFVKELRRDERVTVGRLDSRFVGRDADAAGESYEYDPSYAAILGPFSATLNHYVRAELGFESDLPYEILTGRVHPWSYASAQNQYLNVAETLRSAMTRNPHMRVYVANGYYDLATPYFATEHTFAHLGLEPELRGNVRMGYYEAGHMMYIHAPSRAQLEGELEDFYSWAAPQPPR